MSVTVSITEVNSKTGNFKQSLEVNDEAITITQKKRTLLNTIANKTLRNVIGAYSKHYRFFELD